MRLRSYVLWTVLLAGAQLTDVASTWLGLHFGAQEANPLVSAALAGGSFVLVGAVKLLLVLALAALVLATARRLGRIHWAAWRSQQALVFVLTAVAVVNTAGVVYRLS